MRKNSVNKENNNFVFRVIAIGDSGVGKTSIIRKYLYNIFEPTTINTIGLSFSFKEVILKNKTEVKLKIMDTAGQEKYNSLTKTYYKNADGVLFVFDINNKKSFDSLQKWMELFNENNNGKKIIPIYLLGNKCDLVRNVEQESIDKFIKETGFKYREVSAFKDDETKFSEIFQSMAETLYSLEMENMNNSQKEIKVNKYKYNQPNESKCELCPI
jgi:small GTP-binding protein